MTGMLRITFKQLHYFSVVAQEQNIAAAARKLFISQPAITNALKLLEGNLDTQLLIRHHARGVTLTSSGKVFLVRARNLLAQAHELELSTIDSGPMLRGRLEIGCYSSLAPMYMPRLITEFLNLHPQVDLRLHESTRGDLITGLMEGDLDYAFTPCHSLGRDLIQQLLLKRYPCVILGSNHPLASQTKIHLSELVDHPMVLLDFDSSRNYFINLFRAHSLEPWIRYWSPSFETVRGLVANGLGYSILVTRPKADFDYNGRPLFVRSIAEDVEADDLGLISVVQRRPTHLMKAFQEFSVEHFKKIERVEHSSTDSHHVINH